MLAFAPKQQEMKRGSTPNTNQSHTEFRTKKKKELDLREQFIEQMLERKRSQRPPPLDILCHDLAGSDPGHENLGPQGNNTIESDNSYSGECKIDLISLAEQDHYPCFSPTSETRKHWRATLQNLYQTSRPRYEYISQYTSEQTSLLPEKQWDLNHAKLLLKHESEEFRKKCLLKLLRYFDRFMNIFKMKLMPEDMGHSEEPVLSDFFLFIQSSNLNKKGLRKRELENIWEEYMHKIGCDLNMYYQN